MREREREREGFIILQIWGIFFGISSELHVKAWYSLQRRYKTDDTEVTPSSLFSASPRASSQVKI